jgi:uncharacterized protein (TIGR01777 family)
VKIAVSGASGLIGSHLVIQLREHGHEVITLVRREPRQPGEVRWDPAAGELDPAALTGIDAAINLSGAGIGDKRWTDDYKRVVLESRLSCSRLLANTLTQLDPRPTVLLSGSAIGFYGDTGDTEVDETSPAGTGYLADVCVQWEQAAAGAVQAGIRVAYLRTGLVLSGAGGMLKQQLLLYKAGLGGPLGSGKQWWSWVSLTDELNAIEHLLTADVSGPVDLVGPAPVRQKEFAAELGKALHRPALLPAPGFALKLALGGFAQDGILAGQRVRPGVLESTGFTFAHPTLEQALASSLS